MTWLLYILSLVILNFDTTIFIFYVYWFQILVTDSLDY